MGVNPRPSLPHQMFVMLWMLLLMMLSLPLASPSRQVSMTRLDQSCLSLRSTCIHEVTCRMRLERFSLMCGPSSHSCAAQSPSDCVHVLRHLRAFLGMESCECASILGSMAECELFQRLIFAHPCERLLMEYQGKWEELAENERRRTTRNGREEERRRTTRVPQEVRISQWKKQLSGDLSVMTQDLLQRQDCDVALHEVCLKHISCSHLWRLFRQNCDVDAQNNCHMQQRETCWQSFEGLLWTGLGRCSCRSNSSDCHWIRLHTNFNKCIYLIARSAVPLPYINQTFFVPLTLPPHTLYPTHSAYDELTSSRDPQTYLSNTIYDLYSSSTALPPGSIHEEPRRQSLDQPSPFPEARLTEPPSYQDTSSSQQHSSHAHRNREHGRSRVDLPTTRATLSRTRPYPTDRRGSYQIINQRTISTTEEYTQGQYPVPPSTSPSTKENLRASQTKYVLSTAASTFNDRGEEGEFHMNNREKARGSPHSVRGLSDQHARTYTTPPSSLVPASTWSSSRLYEWRGEERENGRRRDEEDGKEIERNERRKQEEERKRDRESKIQQEMEREREQRLQKERELKKEQEMNHIIQQERKQRIEKMREQRREREREREKEEEKKRYREREERREREREGDRADLVTPEREGDRADLVKPEKEEQEERTQSRIFTESESSQRRKGDDPYAKQPEESSVSTPTAPPTQTASTSSFQIASSTSRSTTTSSTKSQKTTARKTLPNYSKDSKTSTPEDSKKEKDFKKEKTSIGRVSSEPLSLTSSEGIHTWRAWPVGYARPC